MPNRARLCDNCGGKLQVAHAWKKLVVCGDCHAQLSAPPPAVAAPIAVPAKSKFPTSLLAFAAAGIVTAVVIAVILSGGQPANTNIGAVPRVVKLPAGPTPAPRPAMQSRVERSARPEQAAAPAPQPEPAIIPTAGVLAGVASLARNGEDPEPLAELHVQLIRRKVGRQAVRTALETQATAWTELARAYPSADEELVPNQAASVDTPATPATASDDQDIADAAATGTVRLQAAIDALPQEMDAADALKMLADVALFHLPRSQSAFADATVAESRTDSTGKYELKNVAPGDYYLHATQARPSSFIEWCVPVRVEAIGHTVRLDLNRENAAVNVRIAN